MTMRGFADRAVWLFGFGVMAFPSGCGGAPEKVEGPKEGVSGPAASGPAARTAFSVAPVAPKEDAVRTKTPSRTAVKEAQGCRLNGRYPGLALSVDGLSSGVFVEQLSGAKGEIVLVPGGRSAARVAFGAAVFDTGLSIERSWFFLSDRPALIGGVVSPREGSRFRVVGGDKDKLQVELLGHGTEKLEWAVSPRFEVPCQGLGHKSWPFEASPTTKGRLFHAGEAKMAFRAEKKGPVVVNIETSSADLIERSGDMAKVVTWLEVGRAIGWTAASEWSETPAPAPGGSVGAGGGGSGLGAIGMTAVECLFGTPLYLRMDGQLYEVGRLRSPVVDEPKEHLDLRVTKTGIRLSPSVLGPKAPAPWIERRDDFRTTNYTWHDGIRGAFVVPRGPNGCK